MTPKSKGGPATRQLRAVSLYTGAGGMDYGFEAAGFEIRVALEMDRDSCATLRLNRGFPIIEGKIEDYPSKEILAVAGLKRGAVELLHGGPPCQPFSKAAYWSNGDTARLDDPRAATLQEYMRCVEDVLPEVFVLENVYGLGYEGKSEGMQLLDRLTSEINRRQGTKYLICRRLVNMAAFGVPQIRERFFLVAHREGKAFRFPEATHALPAEEGGRSGDLFESMSFPPVTAWDAIGHLRPARGEDLRLRGRWAGLLPSIPEGENYLWHTNRKGGLPLFGWRTRYWSFLLKLAKNRPSWTIQAQPGPSIGPFHWENRLLSAKEMAALQTFPRSIRVVGSRQSVQRQIGNAVPSLFAEILGREIARQFFGVKVSGKPKLTVRLRRPIPSPTPVTPVPSEFLHLVGDHPAHADRTRPRGETAPAFLPAV